MKRTIYVILSAFFVVAFFCIRVVVFHALPHDSPLVHPATSSTMNDYLNSQDTQYTVATRSGQTLSVSIYLVSLKDLGSSGLTSKCGDSLVPVQMTTSTISLISALEKLLNVDVEYYGNPPLYNSLYNSALKVNSATISNGKATIHLSGSVQLDGLCDDQWATAQLEQTALHFPMVKSVDILINGIPMNDVFTEKGA